MTAVAATLSRTAVGGLTVYVAFFLSHAVHAADAKAAGQADAPRTTTAPSPFAPGYGPQTLDVWTDPTAAAPSQQAARPSAPPVGTETPYGPLPPPAPAFRDTRYGAHANPGPPGGPSFLHPNWPDYQTKYGIWYQPRAFWEPTREVYRPQPFRPRGWGNMFVDDPCRHDRMDYNRYVVKDLPSRYGPSYYPLYQPPSECMAARPERHYRPPVWGSAE